MDTQLTLYSIALFLHIVGALGVFVALGLEWLGHARLQHTLTADHARMWLSIFLAPRRLYAIASLLILVAGTYMTATTWGWRAWILLALAAMILLAVIGAAVSGRRMTTIEQLLARESGPLSYTLRQRMGDPVLMVSLWVRTTVALGIVFLMSVKPGLVGSVITLIVASILGLGLSLPALGRTERGDVQSEQAGD